MVDKKDLEEHLMALGGIEEIPVQMIPEPEDHDEGVIDPNDTYVEGVDADEVRE